MGKFRDIFPKHAKDQLLFLFMIIGIPFVFYFELVYVFPHYYDDYPKVVYLHVAIGLYVAANLLANMYKVIVTDTSTRSLNILSGQQPTDWSLCDICNVYRPPRAWHCKQCEKCILRRDHHCLFTGTCIGLKNHRYFLVAVMYALIGAVYGNTFTAKFFADNLEGYSLKTLGMLLAPHFALLFGLIGWNELVLCVLQDLGFMTLITSSYMFFRQMHLMWVGLTMFEYKNGGDCYRQPCRETVQLLLGPRWKWVWMCPWLKSATPGPGVTMGRIVRDRKLL